MMMGGCVWDNPRKNQMCLAKNFHPRAILSRYSFVGITEHFEASVCLFYHTFSDAWRFRKFCKDPETASRMPHVMRGFQKHSSSAGVALDSASLRSAVDSNEMDFKLYWTAYDDFHAKLKQMADATGIRRWGKTVVPR